MSLPPLNPEKTTSGIIVDPRTLERVVPASKRSDGTERKERRIRPGYTPQEDVSRFRSTRAQIYDASKGIVPGAAPKPAPSASVGAGSSKTKAQKKNDKRKEKRLASLVDEGIADGRNWDSEDDETPATDSGDHEQRAEDESAERMRGDVHGSEGRPEAQVERTASPPPVLAPPIVTEQPKPSDGPWRKNTSATTPASATAPASAKPPARAHTPRAGKGKSGPPGLAHEPAPIPAATTPKKEEPRVRKEIRVRPGGVGIGLLSERVRRLVVETQESPSRRESSPGK